jgi:hypothetical protein
MRIYILRTWYPKNFVQNYGAWREFKYSTDGTSSPIPYSTKEEDLGFSNNEIPYWDTLEFGYLGVDRTNWLPQQKLSLYVDKDGNDKYYHNLNGYVNYFKTDVLRKQLNCPLYGINPRGKAMFTESENITKNGANFKTFISLLNNTIDASNNENTSYPEYGDWQGTRYYHSTNLGIRYIPDNIAPTEAQLTQNNLNIFPNDGFRYLKYNSPIATPTNGLTYFGSNNTTLKSPYLLYTKTFNKPYHTTTFENFQYKLFKFIGYTDEGIFSKNSDTGDIDFIQNQNVGFFLREMISNKFDNINYALKVGSIQPGHPLTVDYTAKYMEETSLGNNYTGNIIPRLNDGADDGIGDASALYKTPHEAIIFDSGCITRDGEFRIFDGFGISYGARQHYGAVGNPKDGLNSSGERLTQPRQAKVYGKYDRDRKSYNFCVTIPNWRDYIVDSDFADGTQSEANPYYQENLLESNNLDRKRFSDFFDSLRFVVFSNTDIIENRGITGPENIVDFYNENSNFSAKNLAKNYIMNQPPSESYKISFNNSSLCNPDSQQKQECLCTDYIPDWNSNCYAFAQTRDLCAYLTGGPKDCSFQYKTSIFGSGLGTISICSCIDNCSEVFAAGGCHHSMSVFCSCGDNQNCSCRGESFARPFYFCGNGEGGVSKCEGGCPGSGEDSCRFVLDQWAKISNSQIRKVFIGGNEYYLIKLPPVPGRNSAYVAGNKALNKDSLCGIETCSNPPSIDATNIEYIRIGLDDVFCGSENFCTKNKCIFPLATCNFNGTVEDNDAELSAVLDSINFATSIRACGGSSPFANIPVTELLTQYTDTPQGTCNTSFTDTFINKLIPIEGSEPLCIPLECSVIDCSQYEDCSPT